jgi:hypothetical protein
MPPMCALYCVAAPAGASLFPSSAHLNPVFGGFGGLSPKEVERAGYLKGAACRNWGLSPKVILDDLEVLGVCPQKRWAPVAWKVWASPKIGVCPQKVIFDDSEGLGSVPKKRWTPVVLKGAAPPILGSVPKR